MKVQQALHEWVGKEFLILSISLDGDEIDTPEVLSEYRELYGIGPGWIHLTGDRDEIDHLRKRLGAFDPDPEVDKDKTQHAGVLVAGNEPRGLWMGIPGLQSPNAIVDSFMKVARKRWKRVPTDHGGS